MDKNCLNCHWSNGTSCQNSNWKSGKPHDPENPDCGYISAQSTKPLSWIDKEQAAAMIAQSEAGQ